MHANRASFSASETVVSAGGARKVRRGVRARDIRRDLRNRAHLEERRVEHPALAEHAHPTAYLAVQTRNAEV